MTSQPEPAAPFRDPSELTDRPEPAWRGRLEVAPGTRVLWRTADSVQWESGGRAYVLHGVDPGSLAAIVDAPGDFLQRDPMDGDPGDLEPDRVDPDHVEPGHVDSAHTDHGQIDPSGTTAAQSGTREVAAVQQALHALMLLWRPPRAIAPRRIGLSRRDVPERLLPDLGALAARLGDRAAAAMTARRSRTVALVGTDRLAVAIGSVLAAAGVGRVDVPFGGEARLWQAMPGGVTVADEGRRRSDAAAAAIRAAAPEVDIGSSSDERAPDLMIITGSRPPDDDLRRRLQGEGVPHLVVGVDAVRAVIGPLVVPGRTSCLRCADLHRIDRDPAWPALAAQLATGPTRFEASDVALCTVATGVAALQALSFLDGEAPASMDGTLELTLPDWRVRRRSRPTHDACPCREERA